MPRLTRLLTTRIVASNFSGRSSNFATTLLLLVSELLKELISDGDNEKNAASEPDINADITSSIKITTKVIPRFSVKGFTVKSRTENATC